MPTRPSRPIAPFILLLIVGIGTFSRFAPHVRAVDAVGLSGAGFAFGIGLTSLILLLRQRNAA